MGVEWRHATLADKSGLESGPVFFSVDVSCGCASDHLGSRANQTGCGVSFRVELSLNIVHVDSQP
jgi:hypothetical protein